ncbi:porin [Roseobacter sp. YSTF-M11]|uniref:Porin n=1 Tax=Roseobacter insulae TaxID=2859783 RepID=A0A9X1FTI4_9RHOB|nr:porin [Roseobacter insulae]MBW4707119.1 porin [Roseobacter insulae]
MRQLPLSRLAIPAASSVLLALPHTAAAQDSTFNFYGQLNFGLWSVDDGTQSESFITDNDNSNTRVGAIWESGLANGGKLKFHFETALGLRGSSSVTLDDTGLDFDWRRTELRKVEVVYTTPGIGAFSFGQGSTATDGFSEADFSGTSVIAYSAIGDLAGNIAFRPQGGAPSAVDIGDAFSNFDGARRFRVRYDSPDFSGFGVSVSAGEEVLREGDDREFYDLGLKYARDFGDIKMDARLGYSWIDSDEELAIGSLAMLHEPTGLNAAISTGRQQEGDDDFIYVKLGYIQDWFPAGSTAVSLDLYEGNDFAITGSESSSVGLGIVQRLDRHNVEIYATYRTLSFDSTGTNLEDIDVMALGARWKF